MAQWMGHDERTASDRLSVDPSLMLHGSGRAPLRGNSHDRNARIEPYVSGAVEQNDTLCQKYMILSKPETRNNRMSRERRIVAARFRDKAGDWHPACSREPLNSVKCYLQLRPGERKTLRTFANPRSLSALSIAPRRHGDKNGHR
jgi:hypothetical protein